LKRTLAAGKAPAVIDAERPFVLLDDARTTGASPSRLYRDPIGIIETKDPDAVEASLKQLAAASAEGLHAAGFITYEAGYSLEQRLAPLRSVPAEGDLPLIWFGLFRGFETIAPEEVIQRLPGGAVAGAAPPRPLITREAYGEALARTKHHIAAGDIYQANLTFPCELPFWGEPIELYAALRSQARAGWGGIVFTGTNWLLSFSPELFFTLSGGRMTARPMKGTAKRAADPAEDRAAAEELRRDEKQRAENLMIVDLLRNDLSRVSEPGSVKVDTLFAVETYPTVHQMTSTITSRLEPGRDIAEVLGATFPCGSVTGAPKIRAIEILAELEPHPREAYTGSIGSLAPDGEAAFNVAIRTLTFGASATVARLGLGSAVVADSRADEEWLECLAKGAFVSEGTSSFDLIETMAFDPNEGIRNLERHLSRIKGSADALGFSFDRHHARNELQAATFRAGEPKKLRLLLSRTGAISIESRPMPAEAKEPVEVALAPLPLPSRDFRLRHKTSDRDFYQDAIEAAGAFEVIFVDEEGFLTQGSFTNLFVERDGMLLTPPSTRAVLPGVLRDQLIAEGRAKEADLRPDDLAGGFSIGNAVRGLIGARLTDDSARSQAFAGMTVRG
jgi:para-aminobenzoate synthetase / 4-amino-4-deoxychorismate lyase